MNFVDDAAKNAYALLPTEQQDLLRTLVQMLLDPRKAVVCPLPLLQSLPSRWRELFDEHGTPLPGPPSEPLDDRWAIRDYVDGLKSNGAWLIQLTGDVEGLLLDCSMEALGWLKEHSGVDSVFALTCVSRRMQALKECVPKLVRALNGLSGEEDWVEASLELCNLEMLVWLKQRAGIESSAARLAISARLQTIAH